MKTTSRLREFSAQGFLLASGLRMLSVIPTTAPTENWFVRCRLALRVAMVQTTQARH